MQTEYIKQDLEDDYQETKARLMADGVSEVIAIDRASQEREATIQRIWGLNTARHRNWLQTKVELGSLNSHDATQTAAQDVSRGQDVPEPTSTISDAVQRLLGDLEDEDLIL